MSVVTIRGQLGSGAPEIGKLVADKLNTDYVGREIIAKVAELLNRREQQIVEKELPSGTLLGRIAEALTHGYYGPAVDYGKASLPAWEIPLDDTQYLAGLQSIVKELAGSGSVVIRGRGSQFILEDYPGAIHVLVVAPLEARVKRVMEDTNLDEETAKKEIARSDSSRREFIKRYFQADLEDPVNHDLVINTEHLNFEAAASIIVGALPFKAGL
jgi:cytidylate kinase